MKEIDVFGYEPKILIDSKSAYKTYTGTFLTLALIVFSVILASVSIEEIVMKNRPLVFQTIFIDKQPEKMKFTSSNFYAAGGLENQLAQYYIDESYYTLTYSQITNTKEGGMNYERQEILKDSRRCSEDANELDTTIFKQNPREHMYCFANDQEMELQGVFGNDVFSMIKIEANRCNPAESKVECKSEEEMNARFNGGYFGFDISDNTFDPADSTNSFKKYGNGLFTTIDSVNSKTINVRMSRNVAETDYGILFSSYSSEESYSIDATEEKTNKSSNGNIVTVNFYFSNKRKEYNRSYTKFQTIMANISATAKVLFISIKFAVTPFVKNNFYLEMVGKTGKNRKTANLVQKSNESVNNFIQPKPVLEAKQPKFFVLKSLICPFRKSNFKNYFARMRKLIEEKHDIFFFNRVKGEIELLKQLFLEERHKRFIARLNLDDAFENNYATDAICIYDKFEATEVKESFAKVKGGNEEIDLKLIGLLAPTFLKKLE